MPDKRLGSLLTREEWPVLAIMAAALGLRLYHLDRQGPWYDEALAITRSVLPLGKLTPALIGDFWHPPLYFYLLHAWFALLGSGTFQARLLSVLFGVMSIPMIYLLAWRLYDRPVALLASALLAVSQLGVMYSQEARPYTMFIFLTLLTGYLLLFSLEGKSRLLTRLGLVISATALLYTNYYGIFVLLALAVHTLLFRRSLGPGVARGVLLSLALAPVLFTPWLASGVIHNALAGPTKLHLLEKQPPWFAVNAFTLLQILNAFNNGAVYRADNYSGPRWTLALGSLLFTAPAGIALWRARKGATRQCTSFLLLLCLPVPIIVALSAVWALQFGVRYVIFCVGFYYILVARGLLDLPNAVLRTALIATALACSAPALQTLYSKPYKENYRDALRDLSAQWRAGDCAVFWPFQAIPLQWWIDSRSPQPLLKTIEPQAAASTESACSRVWLVTYRRVELPTTEVAADILSRDFRRASHQRYFWVTLDLYTRVPHAQSSLAPDQ